MDSVDNYEIIEEYPEDKYMPSYLVRTRHEGEIYHILFAADKKDGNVRIITSYHPNPLEWTDGLRRRKKK